MKFIDEGFGKNKLAIKEKIYSIEEKLDIDEVEEYITEYIRNNGIVKLEEDFTGETDIDGIFKKSIFPLDLSKLKFFILPLKIKDYKEKVVIFKNKENFLNGKIEVDSRHYPFESYLCFVIFYSSVKRLNYLFEELIDKIIDEIDSYKKL